MENTVYITYYGVRMIVKRRFEFKGESKLEVMNPKNNSQFVISESDLKQSNNPIDQTIKQ